LNESAAKTLDGMQLQIAEGRRPGRAATPAKPPKEPSQAQVTCEICGRAFKSERSLAIHKARAHRDKEAGGEDASRQPQAPAPGPFPTSSDGQTDQRQTPTWGNLGLACWTMLSATSDGL